MANTNAPFGLRPVRHKNGAPYNGAANMYYYTGSSNLFIGDPVIVNGSSNTTAYYGSPIGSLPTITTITAATANAISGAIVGFFAEDFSSKAYGVGSSARGVYIADDPELIFEIQDDGLVTSTVAFVSAGGNFVTGSGGSTVTNLSSYMLSSTTATSATDQLKILRLSTRSNNAVGQYAVWEVMINYHTQNHGMAGI
jgi:hypothetical protein